MKNFIHKSLFIALCSTAVVACKPTIDVPAPDHGAADFSKYVSIGDGTAGGYADASLNREAQLVAFPNLLAQQFKLVGGGDFIQPLVLPYTSTSTGHTYTSFGFENNKPFTKYYLAPTTFCDGKTELYLKMEDSSIYKTNDLLSILNFKVDPTPTGYYNNLAVQGAKIKYLNKHSVWNGTSDTYWKKVSSTHTAAASMIGDAIAQKPTFVSINIGIVDVMRYAKSGGHQDNGPGNGSDDDITPTNEFHDSLYSMMNILTANKTNGLKGVITNIIDLNSFPYVTYIKYNGLILTADQATDLNSYYAGQFNFHAGKNNYVIADKNSSNACKCRQILDNEFILIEIPQDSLRCHNLGGKLPIRPRWVLDASEVNTINTTIAAYNDLLKTAATTYNFAYVDGNANMKLVKAGTQLEGITLSAEFVNGNYFSLDGLNIGPLGQVTLANNCIDEINKKYGSTIPFIDATKFKGVVFQ